MSTDEKKPREWCEGCTCGKADGGKQVRECVNCHRGDEYRCATCPSRGKPAGRRREKPLIKLGVVDMEDCFAEPWSEGEIKKMTLTQEAEGTFILSTQQAQEQLQREQENVLVKDLFD